MPEETIKNPLDEHEEKKSRRDRKEEKRDFQNLIDKKDKEITEWKNKYYMAYADTENLKKQYDREHQQLLKYRSMGFLEKLLPILDGFHMALSMEVSDPTVKNYLTGFEYIYKMMVEALESEGVTEVNPVIGERFDEKRMDAVDTEATDGEENRVVRVFQKGYMLKDRMVRHARVVVSRHPRENEEVEDETQDETSPIADA